MMDPENLTTRETVKSLARFGLELEATAIGVGDEAKRLTLWLRRLVEIPGSNGKRGPPLAPSSAVLLLHGGNSSGDGFLYPDGGLAVSLKMDGWDVWLLEWRGSPHVVYPLLKRSPLGGSVAAERALFNVDEAASVDIPAGLKAIRARIPEEASLSIMGHCLGAGALSMAIARGAIDGTEMFRVKHVVLSTMGLFYEVPWNGWIKSEDFLIERILSEKADCRAVDPKDPEQWPPVMRKAYKLWPTAWLPSGRSSADKMLQALTFMFGQPFSMGALARELQGPIVESFFGPMHLGLFQHAGQLVRRGYAARFDTPDVIDRQRRYAGKRVASAEGDLDHTHFRNKHVTLISAADNHLWHRDSIDLMYEWLRRIPPDASAQAYRKHVFAGYNIQELLWGPNAKKDVFPFIKAGLAPVGGQSTADVRPRRTSPFSQSLQI